MQRKSLGKILIPNHHATPCYEAFYQKKPASFDAGLGSFGRDDTIRTCDHTPPRRVRYRTALHPDFHKVGQKYYFF